MSIEIIAPAIWITVHYTPAHGSSSSEVRERLVNMALCHRIERVGPHTLLAFGSDIVYCDEQPHAVLRRINESLTPAGKEQEQTDDE
jgi:hypothetical protein